MKNKYIIINFSVVEANVQDYNIVVRAFELQLRYVDEGKISYIGLARNLIRQLISPNQDDLSYSAWPFISGQQIGQAAKHTLFSLRTPPSAEVSLRL